MMTRPVTSVSKASRLASPSPRSKFLFMHLADPKKAPVRGEGRRKSEVGRMLRRPAGQEDLGDDDDDDEEAGAGAGGVIDPKLRDILGLGGAGSGSRGVHQEEDDDDDDDEGDDEDDDNGGRLGELETPSLSASSASSSVPRSRAGRAARHHSSGKHGRRHHHRHGHASSPALNLPPRGPAPLRTPALGYVSLLRGGGGGNGDGASVSSSVSASFAGQPAGRGDALLRARILQAARGLMGATGSAGAPQAGGMNLARRVPVAEMPFANYAERRAALREERERKIQARMMEMVHKGQMPPELLLDDDLAQASKLDADSYENDPDAYETEELLGSDVSSISSTDDEMDTPEHAARRARRRDRRRREKVRVLKRRKRQLWAKKRRDTEAARSRYYDDMIDDLVRANPLLRPPASSADLEAKRAFVDRATAENMTRAKIDQMARWIYVVAVVVENLGMITGFLMLEGLSQAVDTELRKPEMQPVIAQLARKYLRRGPSSPEWGLAIMFLGTAGTVHAMNVRQQEIAQAAAGQGAATGPGSSKFGRVISGAMKVFKVLGLGGGGAAVAGAGPAANLPPGVPPPRPEQTAATIAARYEGQGSAAAAARPKTTRPQSTATAATARTSRAKQTRDSDEEDSSRAPWE
jgi:hypothetical protein